MASLPGPSSPGRRLAELLQEQQEPFLLDVYLVEHGCSGRILCGSESTATCWPADACRRLAGHGFRRRREGLLRSLLAAVAHGRPTKKAPNWRGEALEDGGPPSGMARIRARSAVEDVGELCKIKVDAERAHGWECTEEAKQLSPVSVLELQSDDGSPAHDQLKEQEPSTSGLHLPVGDSQVDIGSASSEYMITKKKLHVTKQPVLASMEEEEEEEESSHQREQTHQDFRESLGPHGTGKFRCRRGSPWRREAVRAMSAWRLIELDLAGSVRWNQFDPRAKEEIAAEMGDAILGDLVEVSLCHI